MIVGSISSNTCHNSALVPGILLAVRLPGPCNMLAPSFDSPLRAIHGALTVAELGIAAYRTQVVMG